MGAFDDLIPKAPVAAAATGGGAFDDLIPKAPLPVAPAGPVVMDDGTVKPGAAPLSPLVMRYAQDPAVQAAQNIKRGTLAGEMAAFGPNLNQAFHSTLIPSMIDYQQSGAADRADAETANWRANMLGGGLDQLDPRQQQMALLDPTLAAQQMGDLPGRPLTTPDAQRQLAQQSVATAIPKEAAFAQQQLRDEAIAQAVPGYDTAEGTLGKVFAGAGSGTAVLLGNLPAIENVAIPGGRAATLMGTFAKNAAPNAVGAVLTDPIVQANRVAAGMQEQYDPTQTGLAGVTGGVLGGTVGSAGHAWDSGKAYMARRNTAPTVNPGSPPGVNADDLFRQAQESSQGSAVAPEETQALIDRMTGVNLPPSETIRQPGQKLTPEQYRARNQTESELSALFNQGTDIHPGGSVRMGEEGPVVAEGALPVRDPTGAQANVDTLAKLRQAEDLLRKNGIEPDEDTLKTVATYLEKGTSPLGAVNAFKRARTMADREGMTPDLERTAGEKANSQQFAKEAFDIADLRRQRREAELDKWNPELEPDYSAGAGRADDLTPRMAQDLAARSQAPYAGAKGHVGSDQPAPRRSVDVIGSKSVGGLRGEYIPGQRPGGPEAPQAGRQGDMFEGERVEPKLEGPAEAPAPKQPAEAPTASGPVRQIGSDDILDRAFAPREQPAVQPDQPNLDHLTPDQQRRVTALDHEIATAKAFGDPEDDIAALQREYDDLVSGKAPESAPEAKAAQTPATEPAAPGTHPRDVLDAIDRELAATHWSEKGGKLQRDAEGNVSRSKWLSSNPDIHGVLTKYKGITVEKARNLIARSRSGKGKPLTERQQQLVDDLAEAMAARNERPVRPARPEPAAKPAEPEPTRPDYPEESNEERGARILSGLRGQDPKIEAKARDQLAKGQKVRVVDYDGEPRIHAHPEDEGSVLPMTASEKTRYKELGDRIRQLRKLYNPSQRAREELPRLVDEIDALEQKAAKRHLGEKKKAEDYRNKPPKSADAEALGKQADDAYKRGHAITHNEQGLRMRGNDPLSADEWVAAKEHFLESQRLRIEATKAAGEDMGYRQQNYEKAKKELEEYREIAAKEKGEKAPDLELKSETEAERAARQQSIKDKTAEQAANRKKAEDKAQADKDREDFKLSGSDREADVAASHGQGTLLDIGAVPGQALRPLKALYRRLFHGSDDSSMKDVAKDLSHATRDIFNQERPTKRGRIADTYRKLMTDTDSSLRSLLKPFKGDIGEQIADALHVQAGDKRGKGASLDERRQQQTNPREHEIEALEKWMRDNKVNTPEAQAQIIKLVENPNTPRRGALGDAAKKVEAFYKDMHKYQTDAGVELGNVKGYFQRVLDNGKVAGHRGAFLKAAKKAYQQDNPRMTDADAQKAAENYWDAEVNGDIAKPGTANEASGGATPSHMKARAFSKDAAKHLDSFYVKEIPAMLSTYLHRAVQRAEIAKSGVTIDGKFQPFGDNFKHWETITDAMRKQDPEVGGVLAEMNKLVGTSAGIMDSKMGSGARNVLGAIRTATTLGTMEKSALSSMTELITPSLRASMGELTDIPTALKAMGEHAYNSARTAVGGKSGRTHKLQNTFDVASAAGIVGGSGQHSLMAARASAGEPTQRLTSVLLSKFFGRNGLENLTNYQRATATGQAMDFLKRLSAPGRQGKAKTERYLGELGIPPKDQQAFTKWVRDLGDRHATPADLKGPMADKYKTAMLRFVDQAIQRPSASTRPAWASDPLGSTIFQLQSFNYAAQKNILNRMFKTMADKDLSVAERGKMAGSFLAHMAAMTGISAAVWEGRDKLYSRPDSRQLTTGAKVERALSGAGAFGKFDQLLQTVGGGVRYGTSPLAGAVGAGAGQIANLVESTAALSGPGNSPNTNTAERKAARTAYQVLGEPALQAALTPLRASPVGMAITSYGVPKAGEKLVDAMLPPEAGNKKELPPIKGTAEAIYDKFTSKDDKKDKKAKKW